MRIHKYRAWNPDLNGGEMMYSGFHLEANGEVFMQVQRGWTTAHNLIVMEYAGYSDRNGKEICEGDFVRSYSRIWPVEQKRHPTTFEVRYSSGSFFPDPSWVMVVVGNTFETPNLLEETA